ncbi:MAG: methionyl-tRNA formyltransferase [Agarilytica sp.]
MPSLNIIFAGTPVFAERHLAALIESEHNIIAVYTQPDRPAGRGKKLTPSAVKTLALKHALPVYQPENLKSDEAQAALASLGADLMIVVAYGLLLPKPVLDIPKFGCINVHGSILPRWRGAAPIQRAIEAGDTVSGVTIMQMDVGLDTGDMLLIRECPILDADSSNDLHDRLSDIGPPALLETVQSIANGTTKPEKQDDAHSNYARKIEKSEAEIQWSEPAKIIDRKIRAFNPFPICFTALNGDRLRIHKAQPIASKGSSTPGTMTINNDELIVQCGEGALSIHTLQLPGKKTANVKEFLNGFAHLLDTHTPLGSE